MKQMSTICSLFTRYREQKGPFSRAPVPIDAAFGDAMSPRYVLVHHAMRFERRQLVPW